MNGLEHGMASEELQQNHQVVMHLLGSMDEDPGQVAAATAVILPAIPAYIREGYRDAAIQVLRSIETAAGVHLLDGYAPADPGYFVGYADAALGLYALEIEAVEESNFFTPQERAAAIGPTNERLVAADSAVAGLAGLLGAAAEGSAGYRRIRRVLRHHRALRAAAMAGIQNIWPADLPGQFTGLVGDYQQDGDPHGASVVLAGAADYQLSLCRANPPDLPAQRAHHEAILDQEAAILEGLGGHEGLQALGQIQGLVEGYAYLERLADAQLWLARGIDALETMLDAAPGPAGREYLLRGGTDWLGLALAAEGLPNDHPGELFDRVHRLLYDNDPPDPAAGETPVLRAFISRYGSFLVYRTPGGHRTVQVPPAHALFLSLQALYDAAGADLEEFRATNAVPKAGGDWRGAMDRLEGELQLGELCGSGPDAPPIPRLLVETSGAGMHVPWTGLLLDAGCPVEAVLVRRRGDGVVQGAPGPDPANDVLVVNGFCDGKYLSTQFERMGLCLSKPPVQCRRAEARSPAHLIAAVTAHPARVLAVGCHGSQTRVTGDLTLAFLSGEQPAEVIWHEIHLPSAPAIILFTCYGGGGLARATGAFGSQAELALAAGARAAVASRWPAWMDGATAPYFESLVRDLLGLGMHPDVWHVAGCGVAFVKRIRDRHIRDWAPWNVYTAGCWLDSPHA